MSFIEAYVEYAAGFTDAPAIFHHRMALFMISSIVNRKVSFRQGYGFLYPNLWMILLAPSGFYHKSYAISAAVNLIKKVNPGLILPEDFSREGLIEELSASSKRLLISYEFQSLMGVLGRDYMGGAKAFLTEIFDNPAEYTRKLKTKPVRKLDPENDEDPGNGKSVIKEPFLNLVAASTIEWFCESLKENDLMGGFLARFFIVRSYPKETSMPWQPPDDEIKREKLVEMLSEINNMHGEMTLTKEAKEFYEEWYKTFEQSRRDDTSIVSPFYPRLTEYAKKFAMLSAIDRARSFVILKEDIQFGCALANTCASEINKMRLHEMTNGWYEKERKKVEQFLIKERREVSREELCRATRIRARTLDEVLRDLEDSRMITVKIIQRERDGTGSIDVKIYQWN